MASGGELLVLWRPAVCAAAVALFTCAATAADESLPPAPAPSVREVVVTAQAPEAAHERRRRLDAFVRRVPALNNGQALARWTKPICPVVVGMSQAQGEYVLLRLFEVARAAGAPVIKAGACETNVYIVATADPEGLVKAWGRRSPVIFAERPDAEVRDFQGTPRAVRAWYGASLDRLTTSADSPFEGLEGVARNIRMVHHGDDSRLTSNSPYALTSAILVVDSARASGIRVGALADYLALAALAQLRPQAGDTDAPSILKLFAAPRGSDPPSGLTAWDTAFLHALYNTRLEDMHQATSVAAHMNAELSRASSPP